MDNDVDKVKAPIKLVNITTSDKLSKVDIENFKIYTIGKVHEIIPSINFLVGKKTFSKIDDNKNESWEIIVEKAMMFDINSLNLVRSNLNLCNKFDLLFTSEINIDGLSMEHRKLVISYIIDTKINIIDYRKLLNILSDNPLCKLPYNIEELNNDGPIELSKFSLFILENYTSIPKTIILPNNSIVSIVKTSETISGKKVFTIRYGIKNSNGFIAYPVYNGISNIIIKGDKFKCSYIITTKKNKKQSINDLYEIKLFLGKTMNEVEELGLNEIEKGKTSKVSEKVIDMFNFIKGGLFKSNIFDAGYNEKGHKVLIIQSINNEYGIFSQMEMNLFTKDNKNIIYIGALTKGNFRIKFINSVPGLLFRIRDIYKKFTSAGRIEIWSFKAENNGISGEMRKDTISSVIKRYGNRNKYK